MNNVVLTDTFLGLQWKNVPQTNLTIEFWLNVIDPWSPEQHLFAYSAYDVYQNPIYDNANEVTLRVRRTRYDFIIFPFVQKNIREREMIPQDRFQFTRATDSVICDASVVPECAVYESGWVHLAVSWSNSDGSVVMFKNGKMVYQTQSSAPGFLAPVVPK